ncbi:MAG: HU family DNA-binding protein [Bacteroidales bacterium]|nr:HU family DNA-binding protein [Bacteroidales bacterium]MCF8334075.1 HU family DNA-binding protein [Bacteroidales bacterium]
MKYISTLLYENDCVIIPGLGGFVSNYEPAHIEGDRNRFVPPYKKILFNSRLTSNDGLLANHIATTEGVTYKEAMKIIERFVDQCKRKLEENRKVRFSGIGTLFKDENDKLLFEQDEQVNYLPQAYGLTQFISPAIYRENSYERFEKQVRTSPVISLRRKQVVKTIKWVAVLVPVAAIATWSYLNFDRLEQKYEQYAIYFKPLHKQVEQDQPNREEQLQKTKEYFGEQQEDDFSVNTSSILSSTGNTSGKNRTVATDNTPDQKITEETMESSGPTDTKKASPATPSGTQSQANQRTTDYHIITGSFAGKNNAERHIRNLNDIGFPARIVGRSNDGYYRVSAFSTDSKRKALQKLRIIRKEDFNNAWLLKK